jgi:hypothetical protein
MKFLIFLCLVAVIGMAVTNVEAEPLPNPEADPWYGYGGYGGYGRGYGGYGGYGRGYGGWGWGR